MVIVTKSPINMDDMSRIRKSGAGSVLLHYAVVKGSVGEKTSTGIYIESAGDMEKELGDISTEIKQRWNIEDILLVRRIGHLNIGDIISLVGVSSPSSTNAFEACRYGLERLKKMKTLIKREKVVADSELHCEKREDNRSRNNVENINLADQRCKCRSTQ